MRVPILLFFLFTSPAFAFYIIEYCRDEVVHGVMKACISCDSTVYRKSCGHVMRVENIKHALIIINNKNTCRGEPGTIHVMTWGVNQCEPARNFEFQKLYEPREMNVRIEKKKKTKQTYITVTQDAVVEEDEYVYSPY